MKVVVRMPTAPRAKVRETRKRTGWCSFASAFGNSTPKLCSRLQKPSAVPVQMQTQIQQPRMSIRVPLARGTM